MKPQLSKLHVKGQKVLIRVDYNVPLDEEGHITDDTRIRSTLPTLRWLRERGAKLILLSHLGRPKGVDPQLSLTPCGDRLGELLGQKVAFVSDCIGPDVEARIKKMQEGDIILLENVRFHQGEEHPEQDPTFVQALAKLGDLYVNDAFGAAHRKHASVYALAKAFPGKAAMGLLMEKEVQILSALLQHPKRPFFALIGGKKLGSKLGVLKSLLVKSDALFIGGGMAYTFFKAQGIEIGDSIVDDAYLETAAELLEGTKIHLPVDIVIRDRSAIQVVEIQDGIPKGWEGVDIGPNTIKTWEKELKTAHTLFWNGPVGIFEEPPFDRGTNALAHLIGALDATTVIGGGDSVAAVKKAHLAEHMTHLSTGGGAALEFIEFGTLPGVDVLSV